MTKTVIRNVTKATAVLVLGAGLAYSMFVLAGVAQPAYAKAICSNCIEEKSDAMAYCHQNFNNYLLDEFKCPSDLVQTRYEFICHGDPSHLTNEVLCDN